MYNPCTCNGHVSINDAKRDNYYPAHFIPRGWKLVYFDCLHSKSLYLMGRCKNCYGDMEEQIPLPAGSTGDALLKDIYEAMQTAHPYDEKIERVGYVGACDARSAFYSHRDKLSLFEHNQQFLRLFHDYDRADARRWLEKNHPTADHENVLRDTGGELFCTVLKMAEENGDFDKAKAILDYVLPRKEEEGTNEGQELTCYEFDFISTVNYGGSEGIYMDCYLRGKFDESGRYSLNVGTLKTLDTSLEAGKILGELAGALMYHASRYVNENIHRYTPEKELLAEKERLERKKAEQTASEDSQK